MRIANLAEVASLVIAIAAAGTGIAAFFLSQPPGIQSIQVDTGFLARIGQLEEQNEKLLGTFSQFESLLDAAREANSEELAGASIISEIENQQERIAAIEATLDLQPREIISLLSLERDIEALRDDVAISTERTIREIDRAYNTVLALVGALLVSVLLLVLGNFLQRRRGE